MFGFIAALVATPVRLIKPWRQAKSFVCGLRGI
jgi:hypothetical protein